MPLRTNTARTIGLIAGVVLLILAMGCSIVYGYTGTTWRTAWDAYQSFNGSNEHLIIREARMPRALIASAVGSSLAIAGVLMQALTKNPLASPGLLGINAGAGLLIVIAMSILSISSMTSLAWIAFLGAALAAAVVFMLGSAGREGLTPMKLTLAGAAIAALANSLTQGVLLSNETRIQDVLYWLAGSIEGRKLDVLLPVLPYLGAAWIVALLISSQINVLMMGDDVAVGLGQRTAAIKLIAAVVVVFLAGGSVAVAGPIGFIGIIVPHLVRFMAGVDHRWVIPYAGVFGALLLVLADTLARFIIMPQEVPVGVMTAFIGTPFFIYIARRGFKASS
ncbi:FecCD family ABC transporter permease [Paenibacillus lutrae]|uniref:Iron chelate uptake ABC transporter family permease subunit n=1 Tax=Paenibacillus lutrae TaxID=2078573 RepID=A0A7X3FLI1_9BACL|nr:iron ABC transporter permease [Paenibacillus lutrae]MVP01684.1 iron chelate uptake ABC transporter family permease subunit [Paenibacillus lutrae]